MMKLSTGQNSTLANYRALCVLVFGPKSKSVEYIDKKILDSPVGAREEVLADEDQMINLFRHLEGL